MAAGRTRAVAQDEHGRALALALALTLALALGGAVVHGFGCAHVPLLRRAAWWRGVSLWCLVQPVRGVWAVAALALCAVVRTSRCLAAQCWHSVCLTKQGRASTGSWSEAYEKQLAPLNYFKGKEASS